jgi:dCMP deaminase
MSKWDERFLRMAEEVSTWSKDPSRKIGVVAVDENHRVLSQGYNGFPRGIDDNPVRYENRNIKYKYIVHGEMNCIYNATYNGVSLHGATLYVYGLPVCNECAKGIIQTGIKKVIMKKHDDVPEKWSDSWKDTKRIFDEAGITWGFLK